MAALKTSSAAVLKYHAQIDGKAALCGTKNQHCLTLACKLHTTCLGDQIDS